MKQVRFACASALHLNCPVTRIDKVVADMCRFLEKCYVVTQRCSFTVHSQLMNDGSSTHVSEAITGQRQQQPPCKHTTEEEEGEDDREGEVEEEVEADGWPFFLSCLYFFSHFHKTCTGEEKAFLEILRYFASSSLRF